MPHSDTTPRIVQWVVGTIIFVVIVSFVAHIIFSWCGKTLSPEVSDMGKVAFGAVTTIIAQTIYRQRNEDTPAGTPEDPVATTEVEPTSGNVTTPELTDSLKKSRPEITAQFREAE